MMYTVSQALCKEIFSLSAHPLHELHELTPHTLWHEKLGLCERMRNLLRQDLLVTCVHLLQKLLEQFQLLRRPYIHITIYLYDFISYYTIL